MEVRAMQQINTIALLSRYPAPVSGKSGAQYTGPTRTTAQAALNFYLNKLKLNYVKTNMNRQ